MSFSRAIHLHNDILEDNHRNVMWQWPFTQDEACHSVELSNGKWKIQGDSIYRYIYGNNALD